MLKKKNKISITGFRVSSLSWEGRIGKGNSEQRPRDKGGGVVQRLMLAAIVVFSLCGAPLRAAAADAPEERYALDIPSSKVDVALIVLARETGRSLIIPSDDVFKKTRARALKGSPRCLKPSMLC
ncbi:MAG: hypothetical protein R3C58_02930 [Parvularculaceae bacterium]